jgi:hypothetical protein
MVRLILIGTVLLLLGSSNAMAQQGPCAADMKILCPGTRPKEAARKTCVREHFKELSGPCQAAVRKLSGNQAAVHKVHGDHDHLQHFGRHCDFGSAAGHRKSLGCAVLPR